MENQQLSQILQQSLSPVHAAVQIPQPMLPQIPSAPPSYLYQAQNVGLFSPQEAPSPYYNPSYNMGSAVVNAARRAYAGSEMMQDIRQITPKTWAKDQGAQMSVDPVSKRLAAAEEVAIRGSSNYGFGGIPLVGGFQSALNTAATVGSFAVPGVGLFTGLGIGLAANTIGSGIDRMVFGGARDLRQAGLALRSSLNVGNLGTPFGLDETGLMRHDVAQNITNQVSHLSFQDTRFSSKQFLQMTDRMANMGMLQGVGSTDEIVNRVKRVSQQLKTFMKVANEPDMLEAIKQMSQLRNVGISDANLSQAASNARAFARMAGVSRQDIQIAGQQTAQMYQQQGLSGAAGYQMGMFTRGLAGQNVNLFSRGLQQMMGGASGIANTMAQGVAGAQRHTTMDMLMHTIFKSQGGGRFNLDSSALNRFMQGGDLAKMFDTKTRQLNASGDMMQHIQDMNERRPELREALQQRLGSAGMMLLTLRQAQALQRVSGGNMTLNTALTRVTGGNQQAARAISRIASSPQATQQLVENMRHEQRRRMMAEHDEIQYQASFSTRMARYFRKGTDFGISRAVSNFNARRQQEIREMAMGTFGRDHDADRILQMNDTQRATVMRGLFSGKFPTATRGLKMIDASTGVPSFSVDPLANLTNYGVRSRTVNEFAGYTGMLGRFRRNISILGRSGAAAIGGAVLAPVTGGLSLIPAAAATLVGATGTELDTMSDKDLLRRAQETGEISRAALQMGDLGSLTSAAKQMSAASDAFFKGTNISDRTAVRKAATAALSKTFAKRQRTFSDASIDFDRTKEAIIEQFKAQGMSEEKARKRLDSQEGKNYLASILKNRMATRTDAQLKRERAQLGDQLNVQGQTFGQQQNNLFDAIATASKTTKEGFFGLFGDAKLDREETSQLVGIIGESGAGTKDERRDAVKFVRLLAQKDKNKLSADGFQDAIQSMLKGKSEKEKKKLLGMMGTLEKKFGGLGQRSDIASVLAEKNFDTDKFADAVTQNQEIIQGIAMQRRFARRLKEDFNIEFGDDKHAGQELLKKAEDSDFIRELKKKGGRAEELASLLQNVREGREGSKEALGNFVTGKGQLRTGMMMSGGTSDAISRRQMQMIQGLHSFASQNARSTAMMGGTVDRLASLIGKSDSGASLGSVVNDFKTAVDKFASAGGIRK